MLHQARLFNLNAEFNALALAAHESLQHEERDDGQHEQVGDNAQAESEAAEAQNGVHVHNAKVFLIGANHSKKNGKQRHPPGGALFAQTFEGNP